MRPKNKEIILLRRSLIWIIYIFSGFILYFKKEYLFSFLIIFAKTIYPLSIFWLQIRIKRKNNFLPIDSSMTTSQLWFSLIPVLSSFLTVIISTLNALLYVLDRIIQA